MFTEQYVAQSNWDRFQYYASFVNILKLWNPKLSTSLLQDVQTMSWAREQPFLPNLRRLELHVSDDRSRLHAFGLSLRPHLRHITVETPPGFEPENVVVLIQLVAKFSPELETISWWSTPSPSWGADDSHRLRDVAERGELELAIRTLTHLTRIEWPSEYITPPSIWKAFGSLPRLRYLEAWRATYTPSTIAFSPDSFPSLEDISAISLYPQMVHPLFSSPHPPHLHRVVIRIIGGHAADVTSFMDIVTQQNPNLKGFGIIWDGADVIQWDMLKGLLMTSTLRSVKMRLDLALGVGDSELAELGRHLPNLEALELAPDPICSSDDASLLTLNVLEDLARYCPRLERLALFVITDQSVVGATRRASVPPPPFIPFKKPLRLNFGLSRVRSEDTFSIALWLSAVCPEGTVVCSEVPDGRGEYVYLEGIAPGVVERAQSAVSQWSIVDGGVRQSRQHLKLLANMNATALVL